MPGLIAEDVCRFLLSDSQTGDAGGFHLTRLQLTKGVIGIFVSKKNNDKTAKVQNKCVILETDYGYYAADPSFGSLLRHVEWLHNWETVTRHVKIEIANAVTKIRAASGLPALTQYDQRCAEVDALNAISGNLTITPEFGPVIKTLDMPGAVLNYVSNTDGWADAVAMEWLSQPEYRLDVLKGTAIYQHSKKRMEEVMLDPQNTFMQYNEMRKAVEGYPEVQIALKGKNKNTILVPVRSSEFAHRPFEGMNGFNDVVQPAGKLVMVRRLYGEKAEGIPKRDILYICDKDKKLWERPMEEQSKEKSEEAGMHKAVLVSIHKKYLDQILAGQKTIEVRTNRPRTATSPFVIFLYETGKDGGSKRIRAKATCSGYDELHKSDLWGEDVSARDAFAHKSCLSEEELKEYMAAHTTLFGWRLENVRPFDCSLAGVKISRAPQSWCYVDTAVK